MQGIPLARASQFIQVTNALEACGVTPEPLMRRLRMPTWHHSDPEAFVPYLDLYRLIDRGAKAAGLATFGVRVMELSPFTTMGQFGRLVAAEPTPYRAIAAAAHLLPRLGTGKRWWLHETPNEVWFCRRADELIEVGEPEAIQFALTGFIQMVRRAVPDWRPSNVWFQTGVAPELARSDLFSAAEIHAHRPISAIAIPRSVLCWTIKQSPRSGLAEAASSMSQDPPPTDFVGSLKSVIETLLADGSPPVEVAAEVAGLEVRTLQRRLQAEGTTYKALVERARFDAAKRWLGSADVKVTEIAFELGYSDAAHFTRAFRRWTGVSPREYRALRPAH